MLTSETISRFHWNESLPDDINATYRSLQRELPPYELCELQLSRSFWAKGYIAEKTLEASNATSNHSFTKGLKEIGLANGALTHSQAKGLLVTNEQIGNEESSSLLAYLIADYGDGTQFRDVIRKLDPSGGASRRLGPAIDTTIQPVRRSRNGDPEGWLREPAMGVVEFVDGNPDHIRVRGIELRSGDIGVIQLNKPGDGILEGFLTEPAVASHAVLYVTRRVKLPTGKTLFQPSAVEIYEGGWRSIPITTALNGGFSWYSEWVRPTDLPEDIGAQLSDQLDRLGNLAFDFQGRQAPPRGDFSSWEQPCATCTNFIRIPFEMAGVSLPYPTTPVHEGACQNLVKLEVGNITSIYTPTNILVKSGFEPVGIVDNGFPELALAQALIVGRPELPYTFGGILCQKPLIVENLPDWKSISKWRSAWANLLVHLGQTEHAIGKIARYVSNVDRETVPLSAPAATIAFYLRCECEAKYIMRNKVLPYIRKLVKEGLPSYSVEQLHQDSSIAELIQSEFRKTALLREGWFGD